MVQLQKNDDVNSNDLRSLFFDNGDKINALSMISNRTKQNKLASNETF